MTEEHPEQWAVSQEARDKAAQVAEERGVAPVPPEPAVETRGGDDDG
jgi:hypothetical protein